MKKDMDLIRSILLAVEAADEAELEIMPSIDGFSQGQVAYHCRMLIAASFLTAIETSTMEVERYQMLSLTWFGHEFLDTVRDPEIWRQAKTGALKVGSWSVSLLTDLAKAAVTAKATSLGLLP